MPLGTKNRQQQQAEACKHYLRATHRDKLALVEEFIAEFESRERNHIRWSDEFSDQKRIEQEMLQRANAAFEQWLNPLL